MAQVALITGASSGIGKSIAEHLSNKGFIVYGTARVPENYQTPKDFSLISLDVTDLKSIKQCVQEVIDKEGRIDVLINNAGRGMTGPVEETDMSQVKALYDTNYFGPVAMIQEVLPLMRKQKGGTIINVTSIAGYMGLPFRAHYSSVKSALSILTEGIRLEVKPFGVSVYSLAPGDFATDIASRRFNAELSKDSAYQNIYKQQLELFDKHVDTAMDPIDVANKIEEIITKKPKRIHFLVANKLQRLSVLLLKKVLSQAQYEKLLANHYNL